LLPSLGNNGEFYLAFLDVKQRVTQCALFSVSFECAQFSCPHRCWQGTRSRRNYASSAASQKREILRPGHLLCQSDARLTGAPASSNPRSAFAWVSNCPDASPSDLEITAEIPAERASLST